MRERNRGTEWVFQYSPESFTGTELDFAVEICDAVNAVWEPTPSRKSILNLPATVEMATPNIYADQIEWFLRHVSTARLRHPERAPAQRSRHRRGGGGAGGDGRRGARRRARLFGNGERTGNVDIVTLGS